MYSSRAVNNVALHGGCGNYMHTHHPSTGSVDKRNILHSFKHQ